MSVSCGWQRETCALIWLRRPLFVNRVGWVNNQAGWSSIWWTLQAWTNATTTTPAAHSAGGSLSLELYRPAMGSELTLLFGPYASSL